MTTPDTGRTQEQRTRFSRGDKAALVAGVLLAMYAFGWFTLRSVQNLQRDRAVAPAGASVR
jgi:hypothetical protein